MAREGFRLIFLLLICLLLGSGCGRKASPKPPETIAPSPVRYLAVTPEIGGMRLSWQAPITTASGDELFDLEQFEVNRALIIKDKRPRFDTVASIDVPPRGESRDRRFEYFDEDVTPGQRYEYYVVAINDDGTAGVAAERFRVRFSGTSSVVERLGGR